MQNVLTAFAVAKSQYITQNSDHNIVVFFFFINLVYNHIYQTLLVRIKCQCILDSFLYDNRVKRPCNIIGNTHLIGFTHSINRFFRGDHNNWSFIDPLETVHPFQDSKTIHLWHVDIQQHQVNLRIFFHYLDCLISIFSFQIIISFSENLLQYNPVKFRIIHNKYFLSFIHYDPFLLYLY